MLRQTKACGQNIGPSFGGAVLIAKATMIAENPGQCNTMLAQEK
jgi:hypothetical protein